MVLRTDIPSKFGTESPIWGKMSRPNHRLRWYFILFLIWFVNSHLKCKAGFVESFQWSEIVESFSWSIVESLGHVCKGVVRDVSEVGLPWEVLT